MHVMSDCTTQCSSALVFFCAPQVLPCLLCLMMHSVSSFICPLLLVLSQGCPKCAFLSLSCKFHCWISQLCAYCTLCVCVTASPPFSWTSLTFEFLLHVAPLVILPPCVSDLCLAVLSGVLHACLSLVTLVTLSTPDKQVIVFTHRPWATSWTCVINSVCGMSLLQMCCLIPRTQTSIIPVSLFVSQLKASTVAPFPAFLSPVSLMSICHP